MPAASHQKPHGFTLVELMVVIAVISVLVAVLLPSLSAARSQARQLVCLTNLRTCNNAMLNYSIDNNLAGAPHSYRSIDGNGPHWLTGSYDKVNGDKDNWSTMPAADRKFHGIFQGLRSYFGYTSATSALSTIYYQYKGCPDYTRSIASNGVNRYTFFANNWLLGRVVTAETDSWYRLNSHLITSPAAMMLMMESSYQGAATHTGSNGFGSVMRRTMLGESTSTDTYTARHRSEGLNVAFIDGHAQFRKHRWGANAFETPIVFTPQSSVNPY